MYIKFVNIKGLDDIFPPEPASKNIPSWYKDLNSYIGDEKKPTRDSSSPATVKRCMPVFDAMYSGYIIKSQADVYISQHELTGTNEESMGVNPYYQWSGLDTIAFHPLEQMPVHPNNNGHKLSYPKWMNPWSIKTPPGYSTLFVQPFHRESLFTILPGVVDTDKYFAPVNFPFVLNDINFEGLIPAGTPIAQVIPFKRETWKMEFGTEKDLKNVESVHSKLRSRFFDSYKSQFRENKTYK
jgi:hypothetical protein